MRPIGILAALLLAACAGGETLEFMIAPTRQDPSLDWWYAVPTEFTPQLSLISSVAKGEYFNIIPVFSNYAVDTNRNARITYDFDIRRPDGSTDEAMKNCDGHDGPAAPPNLLAARAVLHTCFDPEDPYGNYTINVTAYDHISNQTNRQSITVEQRAFTLVTLSEEERDELFLRYAAVPDPSRALAAFLQTGHSFFDEESEPIWSAIWFFKTVFENNEFLMPHLLEQFVNGTPKQQRDTVLVCALMERTGDLPELSGELIACEQRMKALRIPDPYTEVTTGRQLDMLWAEYFATGRIKPIRQLVTSLNLCEYAGTLDRIQAGELDPRNPEVRRTGMLEAVFQSALWSLRSNCEQSPLLYHYCVGILSIEDLAKPARTCLAMTLKSITDELKEKP